MGEDLMKEDQSIAVADIEEYAKEGKPIPRASKYRIRIDRERYEVAEPMISGRELLQLAGKIPVDRFAVYQKRAGGATERIGLDQRVDLREPGVERFVTLPLDQTEG
jgi:Multiubiquitin